MRTLLGVGNDNAVFSYAQSQDAEIAGTALGAFGSAEGGVPSTVIAPSLLFEEVEVHGPHGEPRRLPLVPPPPLQQSAGRHDNPLSVSCLTDGRMHRRRHSRTG